MNYEKVLKRLDGSQVKVSVTFYIYMDTGPTYYYSILTKGKGKKKWNFIAGSNDYINDINLIIKYVTQEEITKAKMELWELLKPTT